MSVLNPASVVFSVRSDIIKTAIATKPQVPPDTGVIHQRLSPRPRSRFEVRQDLGYIPSNPGHSI